MAEKRLRKRSTRQSEPDLAAFEEPPSKKPRRREQGAVGVRGKRKQQNSNSSSPSSVKTGTQRAGKRGSRRLLVSLNLQDNDLHVPGTEVARKPALAVPRGKGRGKLTNQQRDQSVGSDGGSSNSSGGNGRTMAFKNPNFTVSTRLVSRSRLSCEVDFFLFALVLISWVQ